jgi:hypothetical protein
MNRRNFVAVLTALVVTPPAFAQRVPEIDVHLNPT